MKRGSFWLRRLHSLIGVIPLFLLVTAHMMIVVSHVYGNQLRAEAVTRMPGLVEGLLLGSFLLHAVIGVAVLIGNRGRRTLCPKSGFSRLQIVSSIACLAFMLAHITVSKRVLFSGIPGFIFSACFFAMGLLSFGYHIGYGLFTFCLTWGIARGEKSLSVCRVVTVALGAAFCAAGFILYGRAYSEIWAVIQG